MLLRCIRAENRKLHASPIWFMFFILPIISAGYGTFNYLQNLEILRDGWYSLWTQHTLFYSLFFFPCMVAVYAAYLWRLERVEQSAALGPVLHICGADLMDGTPIFDIKPYLPYTDSHPDAVGGFTDGLESRCLRVECPPRLLERIPADSREGLLGVLAGDPRPRYQEDPQRVYGMGFAGQNVRFTVDGETLTVHSIDPLEK